MIRSKSSDSLDNPSVSYTSAASNTKFEYTSDSHIYKSLVSSSLGFKINNNNNNVTKIRLGQLGTIKMQSSAASRKVNKPWQRKHIARIIRSLKENDCLYTLWSF